MLNLVGKFYSRIINNCPLKYSETNHKLHEDKGGFRIGRCCVDNVFALNELIQGHIKECKSTLHFF